MARPRLQLLPVEEWLEADKEYTNMFFKRESKMGDRGEPLPVENDGPPDTYRPYGLCPRCGKQSSFQVAGSIPVTFDGSYILERDGRKNLTYTDQVSSLICRGCQQGVVVVEEQWVGEVPARDKKTGGEVTYRGIHWWPLPQAAVSPAVPTEITEAFSEAITCLSAQAPRAAAAMARRTLEAITVNQGETKGVLADRLKALATRNLLQPNLADWAKEVRLIGNTGAHFDLLEQVTLEDAKDLINFIRELVRYLYELPADLDKRRKARTTT